MRRTCLNLTILALVTFVWGCVIRTEHKIEAHVTVDIRYIEEQADDILDYIEGSSDQLPGLEKGQSSVFHRVLRALDPMPAAYAEEMKTSSPEIKAIAERMRARNDEVETLKKTGALGENNRGYLEIFETDELKANADRLNAAQKVKAVENNDRKQLYKEVAMLNEDQKLNVGDVERLYARKRLERAKPGEKFQLPDAGEDFNAFKASELGKKLGDACKPGEWVTFQ